jgi:hypothetical protein
MHVKILIEGPWSNLPIDSRDVTFLRSWAVYDSAVDVRRDVPTAGFNWNALLGLVMVVGISASFWAGVGTTLSRLLK